METIPDNGVSLLDRYLGHGKHGQIPIYCLVMFDQFWFIIIEMYNQFMIIEKINSRCILAVNCLLLFGFIHLEPKLILC